MGTMICRNPTLRPQVTLTVRKSVIVYRSGRTEETLASIVAEHVRPLTRIGASF